MLHQCFDALDVDGSGCLDQTDLIRAEEGQLLLEKLRLQYGINEGDR